jgi:hypothetical protein
LLFVVACLTIGQSVHFKGAVPAAFMVGGAMMIGGLAVGILRSLLGGRDRA